MVNKNTKPVDTAKRHFVKNWYNDDINPLFIATFASLVWSPDEKYILYVAEKEKKSLKTYFDSTVNDIDDKDSNGKLHLLRSSHISCFILINFNFTGDANETKLNKVNPMILYIVAIL